MLNFGHCLVNWLEVLFVSHLDSKDSLRFVVPNPKQK